MLSSLDQDLYDQNLPNPNPKLLDQLSARLRNHIGAPKPEKERKFHISTTAGISVSVSTALHDQVHQYAAEQQPPLSISKLVQTATIEFITQHQTPTCPIEFTPNTKFTPRNRLLSASASRGIYEEFQAFADKHGLTVVAVVRRAVYEYTKPKQHPLIDSMQQPRQPDLAATIDAWADRAK